jgi:hypothetical protein
VFHVPLGGKECEGRVDAQLLAFSRGFYDK